MFNADDMHVVNLPLSKPLPQS
jgi:hypothetical protein